MRHTTWLAGLVFAVIAPTSASAALLHATFTGFAISGKDETNVFGLGSNVSLGGQPVTVALTFDTNRGSFYSDESYALHSGSYSSNPVISAKLTVAGTMISLLSTSGGQDRYVDSGGHYDRILMGATRDETDALGFRHDSGFNADVQDYSGIPRITSLGFLEEYSFSNINSDMGSAFTSEGNFRISVSQGGNISQLAYGRVWFTDVDITRGVPEPATWAMMILGFGLVGGSLRRRGSYGSIVASMEGLKC